MLRRVAIILEKSLELGEVGNVAAILMGQAALSNPEIYDQKKLLDMDGAQHAAIQFSTVLLKGGQGQILNLTRQIQMENISVYFALFTKLGQGLHNAYETYNMEIQKNSTESLGPVGIVIVGEDEVVRNITKKFSLLK